LACPRCSLSPYVAPRHRDPHSFPTRRSSDLPGGEAGGLLRRGAGGGVLRRGLGHVRLRLPAGLLGRGGLRDALLGRRRRTRPRRSEEHTSELQSRFDLVCRLLLEKKKTTANV